MLADVVHHTLWRSPLPGKNSPREKRGDNADGHHKLLAFSLFLHSKPIIRKMNAYSPRSSPGMPTYMATSAAAAVPPSLLTQVGMAGTAAVITVTFIHPIDVVK